ncbi:TAXI family TRAP transporter solute-binding subunit [Roseitranquillus sediminis]|uniref:TAXI family TRAP transporter solute-binding subunit n=1 Tax=Roseitranquillus sediminis TaxID=2809051 RepID=UPI001D0C3697|nr:TAXI family TRAP transporter solute-binding subunit [Roseitranquillus sediminis]MBM9594458.1 TAXI family TRAP transporter solute-binding subunit [Roseitranquillus sediminis]
MTKRYLGLITGLIFGAALGAPATAQTTSIGTNPQGSLFYTTGTAIASVMNEKTGEQYRVAPFGGSSTYLPMVARGELEFGLTNSAEAAFAHGGGGMFEDNPNENLRLVGSLFPAINGFMVRADSDIEDVADLAGRRVAAEFTAGRTFHYLSGAALAASGLTWDDVTRVPVPEYVAGVDMLIDGRVDAAYSTVGVAAAQRANASIPSGIRFLSLDHSGNVAERMNSVMPTAEPVTMRPSEADNGIVEDPTNLMQMQFVLVTGADMPAEAVYEITKTLHESKPELAAALGAFNRFNPEQMKTESPVPYHEGALRYYREIGLAE